MDSDQQQPSKVPEASVDVNKLPRGAISMRGMPMGRNARLPSIRTPRDLTLVGPPKRTFVPNIPVRRDKKSSTAENEAGKVQKAEGESKQSLQKSSFNSKPKSSQRGRGRKEYVQLPGAVFGQGIKTTPKSGFKVDNDVKTVIKPVISRQSRSSSSAVNTEVVVKKEPKTDGYASSDGGIDYDNESDDDADYEPPVCLPLKIDPESKVKLEKGSKAGWNHEFIKHCTMTESNNLPEDVADLLFNSNGAFEDQLMFFEFPDTIIHPLHNEDFDSSSQRNVMPGPSSESSNLQPPISEAPSWNQAVEGNIGKLQILRSGKTRLVIKDYILDDLELYESSPVFQELAGITGHQSNLDMIVLGQVKHRVRFMSDIQSLADIKV